jgi:hypothetical protein
MLDPKFIQIEKQWAQKVVTNAKSILLRHKKIAAGTLYNSIKYNVSSNGSISFTYAEDGKWVESGRRKGAKMPPPAPIEKWIQQKGIKGTNKETGKPLTNSQLAWIIGRSISEKGIKPLPFMQMAIDASIAQLTEDLGQEVANYITQQLAKI